MDISPSFVVSAIQAHRQRLKPAANSQLDTARLDVEGMENVTADQQVPTASTVSRKKVKTTRTFL
jgi:hypothetical protein